MKYLLTKESFLYVSLSRPASFCRPRAAFACIYSRANDITTIVLRSFTPPKTSRTYTYSIYRVTRYLTRSSGLALLPSRAKYRLPALVRTYIHTYTRHDLPRGSSRSLRRLSYAAKSTEGFVFIRNSSRPRSATGWHPLERILSYLFFFCLSYTKRAR